MNSNKSRFSVQLACLFALFLVILLPSTLITAEGAAFVKFEGVDGESSDDPHKRWSDILSLSQTSFQEFKDETTRLSEPSLVEGLISITKPIDKASPKLAESLSNGKVFPWAEIQICENSSDRICYYKYQLVNVMISTYAISGTSSEEIPMEEITLNFEKIKISYSEIKPDGTIGKTSDFKWNVLTGETSLSGDSIPAPSPSDFEADSEMETTSDVSSDIEIPSLKEPSLEIESMSEEQVPDWIKNNARWWADNQIQDSDFTLGIQYLIQEEIIVIPSIPVQASEKAVDSVPDWVRNNADWWSKDLISEAEFLNAIKYLIEQGIIIIGS